MSNSRLQSLRGVGRGFGLVKALMPLRVSPLPFALLARGSGVQFPAAAGRKCDVDLPALSRVRSPRARASKYARVPWAIKVRWRGARACIHSKLREQSQNVYENKGPAAKSTTSNPSLPKEGNWGSPPRLRKGGGRGTLGPWRAWRAGVKVGL